MVISCMSWSLMSSSPLILLPDWFRKIYFSFHGQVRLRLKLAAGLDEPWGGDGGIPRAVL